MISGDKPFKILYISVASIWRFLSCTVTDLSVKKVLQMIRNDLYRQFAMHSHEVFYDVFVSYELSRLVDNMQIVTNAFEVSASFEAITLILLPGGLFFGYAFGQYLKGDLQMSIYGLQVYVILLHIYYY